jgi:alpha-N-acetylglucosamine transferase
MKYLAYYTVGYQPSYITVMELSIRSMRMYNPEIDIRIICDIQFREKVARLFPDARICERPNSATPEIASMQKLSIFQEDLSGYDAILFIDSDILVGIPIASLLDRVVNDNRLYAYAESNDISDHRHIYWSLNKYTDADINFFTTNYIRIFNAGLFSFRPSDAIRDHFCNIQEMIRIHKGPFFYEQSFMNVYFNTRNLVDYSIWTPENYIMHASNTSTPVGILHFCGSPGNGGSKIHRMTSYIAHTKFFERE